MYIDSRVIQGEHQNYVEEFNKLEAEGQVSRRDLRLLLFKIFRDTAERLNSNKEAEYWENKEQA